MLERANWDHNYNLWLRVAGDNIFRSTGGLGTGSFVRHPNFGAPGFSYWAPPDGTDAVLVEDGDSFVCRFPNGDRHVYERDPEHPFLHRVTRIGDKHGNQLLLSYSEGRLVQVQVNHHLRVVQFRYDDQGRIIGIEDYTGRRWCYTYDFFGDLIAVTAPHSPCGSTVRYEYSSAHAALGLQHNLIRIFDAEGRFYLENAYGQDRGLLHFNRVIRQRLGSGDFWFEYEDFEEPLDFEYEDIERPEHVTTLTERNGQRIRHVYNTFGNLLRKEQCGSSRSGARHLVSRYRYNRDGALVGTLTPEGVVNQSLFGRDAFVRRFGAKDDADLRLHPELSLEVRQGFGRLLATVERGRHLNTSSLVFSRGEWGDIFPNILADPAPADIVRKLTYEPTYGQLRTVSDPRFTRSADPGRQSAPLEHPEYGATLTHYVYRGPDANPASDPTLLLHQIVRPRANTTIGPLALAPGTETLVYDLAGNRVSEKTNGGGQITYTVNDLDQYTSRDGVSFFYDPSGNMIRDGDRTYVYDHAGRLVAARGPGLDIQFVHDCLGRRVMERRLSETTLLIYDRDNLIAEYKDGALFAQHVHADGLDRPVQTAVRTGADGAVFWFHADVTGSIRMLTDRTAARAARYRYDPFGAEIPVSADAPYNLFRFAARRLDPELGSYDFRSRQYQPVLGRFLQRDPLGITTDPNLYTYAGNNPLTFSDPLGTSRTDRQKKEAIAAKEPGPPAPPQPPPAPPVKLPEPTDKPVSLNAPAVAVKPEWAKPELAERHLKDYDQRLDALRDKRNALYPRIFQAQQKKTEAVNMQKAARAKLDEIRRNDIWPNSGTLNSALTVAGTIVGCWTGSCLISVAIGAYSFYDTDGGAAVGAVTSCAPGPKTIGCGVALVTGGGSMLADRRDQQVKAARRSAKEEANLLLDRGRKAQAAAEAELSNLKVQQDALEDEALFLRKMHDFAKYGYPADNPMDQPYKTGTLL